MATVDILSNILVQFLVIFAPRESLLGCHAERIVFSDEIKDLGDGSFKGDVVLVHE